MPLKNIILTGSIGSIPTQSYGQKMYISSTEQQSFPIERITGSSGGTFQNFNSSIGLHTGTELFINVTQSYLESIDTIAGIRTFIHDTQEEFINGEFSGSNLMVADQRLIDEDCVEFLNVNTTLVNYKTYFYYSSASLYNETPISNFLDNNTSPNDGEMYLYWQKGQVRSIIPPSNNANKILYIKIARKDVQGNDNTLSLQELTNLRLKFSDVSPVTDYPIATITERPSYYLYTLSSIVNVTSSADNNVLNHAFSASIASNITLTPGQSENLTLSGGYIWTESIDASNYFNPSTGIYLFQDTPNHKIIFTASALFTFNELEGIEPIGVLTLRSPNGSTFSNSNGDVSGAPFTVTVQGTASYVENNYIYAEIKNLQGPTTNVSNIRWSFTQSLNPASPSSTLTILEPYLLSNFRNTDCDVTMNNVSEQEVSGFYRKVNYNSGATIPTNQQQIISQDAEFADVKDYNYSARAHILPRYNGVRTVQQNENIWSVGDDSFGKTPSVQSLGTYFAYFDWMGGTTPELTGKAAAHILYLIDVDGNILNPSLSSSYYYNLIDNFESGKKANIIINAISGNPLTIGNIPIIRAGTIPMPIIASQTGSTPYVYNIQSTMSFGTSGSNIPNYTGMFGSASAAFFSANMFSDFSIPITFEASPNISLNSNILTINSTSNLTRLQIQISLNNFTINSSTPEFFTIIVRESYDGGATFPGVMYTNPAYVSNIPSSFTFTTDTLITPINSYKYKILIYNGSYTHPITVASSNVNILQSPQPSLKEVYSSSLASSIKGYFTSSLQSTNVLTGSSNMSLIYNPTNPYTQQNNTTEFSSSGYFPFLPFTIQPGDQIRFEGDENQVYGIISATPKTGFTSMSILLDGNVTAGTNLNSFLIRRFHPNPSFITIDSDLSTYQGGGGFILPQFTTNELQESFNKNIVSLKERGLIT
jgi:hypothetical protein